LSSALATAPGPSQHPGQPQSAANASTEDVEKERPASTKLCSRSRFRPPVRNEYGAVVGETAIDRDVAEQGKASGVAHRVRRSSMQTMGADQMHI